MRPLFILYGRAKGEGCHMGQRDDLSMRERVLRFPTHSVGLIFLSKKGGAWEEPPIEAIGEVFVPQGRKVKLEIYSHVTVGKELDFFRDFAPDDLQMLVLSGHHISDPDIQFIGRLTGLRRLYVVNKNITEIGLKSIEKHSKLVELNLAHTQIGDAGLIHIKNLSAIQQLILYNSRITDEGLSLISGLHRLRILSVGLNQVSDAGLAHLGKLKELQELDITHTQITDAGLAHIQRINGLKKIYVEGTFITVNGMTALRSTLPDCQILLHQNQTDGSWDNFA